MTGKVGQGSLPVDLQAHYAEEVPLQELGNVACLSPFHLARVFRQSVGVPPHAYQTHLRLAHARTLLAQGLDVGHVAHETGFLSRGLAKLAGTSGVTVNAVLPGVTLSEWVETTIQGFATQFGQSFEEAAHAAVKARYPTSITQRAHALEEVANLVVYLCSRQSSATTGAALHADGEIIESIS